VSHEGVLAVVSHMRVSGSCVVPLCFYWLAVFVVVPVCFSWPAVLVVVPRVVACVAHRVSSAAGIEEVRVLREVQS